MRELKTITLPKSKIQVKIIEELTFGESQKLQSFVVEGASITTDGKSNLTSDSFLKMQYKTFETCIKEIKNGEEEIKYSQEWMENLSQADGEYLQEQINLATSPKKK